ncbi:MAG: cytidylate kinase-like family protein [candidate division NC10 bacterium]|nr:cytidylate kinase-like family protein [candidate division NC10 bacterium]
MAIITISRQLGSGGDEAAKLLAKETGFTLVDKARIETLAGEQGLSGPEVDQMAEDAGRAWATNRVVHVDLVQELILNLASEEDLIILGHGGQFIFRGFPGSLHVRIIANRPIRIRRVVEAFQVDEAEASRLLERSDADRGAYIRYHYGEDVEEPSHYDLVIRTDAISPAEAAHLIIQASEVMELKVKGKDLQGWLEGTWGREEARRLTGIPAFAHPSEEEFARVLDFYRIRWVYEPRAFALAWDKEGRITEAFTPDFYLPDLDLYIELTTLKQDLVTEKNRKIRRLKELYPEVKLKVFYGRDFRSLLTKYGSSEVKKKEDPK